METTVQEALVLWRSHILEKGNLGGIEYDSEHYRTLVETGPNCLSEVFSAFRQEADLHVVYYFTGLIKRIAHLDFFGFSKTPLSIMGYEYHCTGERPILSLEMGQNGLPVLRHPERTIFKRDRLLQWWDQRVSFLERQGMSDTIRQITGRTDEEFLLYDKGKAREFQKLGVYGIYNIPDYLARIDQDNNPIVFCDFLRISNHPEFKALHPTKDVISNTRKANSKYASRQQKVELVRKWWEKAGATFTRLQSLHAEIAGRVANLS